jgi:hypothetical protein
MSVSLKRRVGDLERARAACRPIRFVFRDTHETEADVAARKRAMIESGWASPTDEFITWWWKPKAAARG